MFVRKPNSDNPGIASEAPALTLAEMLEQPGYLIRRLHQLSTAAFMAETKGCDLTPIQFSTLLVIGSFPNADAAKISNIIAFDRTTVGQVLGRLEQKGLIVREQGKDDKRRKNLTLTPAGTHLAGEVSKSIPRVEQGILGKLRSSERATLIRLLQKLVAPTLVSARPDAQAYDLNDH